jgi:hypothetical protein
MTYKEWLSLHVKKHRTIMQKLSGLEKEEILEYFKYENMKKNEPNFCPLYAQNKKCHDMEELNCYLCACPHFRFCDEGIKEVEGKMLFSFCQIASKSGKFFESAEVIHQDCSCCTLPHTKNFILKVFERDLSKILSVSSL